MAAVDLAADLDRALSLSLHGGDGLAGAEPDTIRFRLYRLPACPVRHARQRWLRIEAGVATEASTASLGPPLHPNMTILFPSHEELMMTVAFGVKACFCRWCGQRRGRHNDVRAVRLPHQDHNACGQRLRDNS